LRAFRGVGDLLAAFLFCDLPVDVGGVGELAVVL
jgi:hypothetical protein